MPCGGRPAQPVIPPPVIFAYDVELGRPGRDFQRAADLIW